MKTYLFDYLWKDGSWHRSVQICVDDKGCIATILPNHVLNQTGNHAAQNPEFVPGFFIPPFANGHSHGFQYAMAGTAEFRQNAHDDFWSWRERMYDLALGLSLEQIFNISCTVYLEMLRMGITAVTEFHYIHLDPEGRSYHPLTALAATIIDAAQKVGIAITMVPVFYKNANFDQPAAPKHKRFVLKNLEQYFALVEDLDSLSNDSVTIGVGAHSLRAVGKDELLLLLNHVSKQDRPFHIHIAEQQKEVTDCLNHWGQRPVAWLMANAELTKTMNLIHATHMDASEIKALAQSPAQVVLCPSTEASLGDGIFPFLEFWHLGGKWAIGSDSQVGLNFCEELRWLDYQQRLLRQKRNIVCQQDGEDSGTKLLTEALLSGRRACGLSAHLQIGTHLDGILLNPHHPSLAGKPLERILSSFVFAQGSSAIKGVMRKGAFVVWQGQHLLQSEIESKFLASQSQYYGH